MAPDPQSRFDLALSDVTGEVTGFQTPEIPEASEQAQRARWRAVIAKYQRPSTPRALWQITNTVVPYVLLWC